MTQQSQEAKQTDREPEEKLEIKALFQTKRIPDNVLCGESTDGLKLQDHLHIKKEEEELWESLEEKQETDITAVTVKSEDEEEEAQCSLLHWRQSEENIKGEPATCSSAKLMKVEPNGDISEGPEAANTWTQPDSDGEETDCSDTEGSEDWREPLSQSEAQSEHMDMSCESFQTSDNTTKGTAHKPFGCDLCGKRFTHKRSIFLHKKIHTGEKPYSCDLCGKEFTRKSSLSMHSRIHKGEKPYSCDLCEKRFGNKAHLKSHTTSHTGEKPFGCDMCGKRFGHRGHLKIHTRIHTGEKPFGCDVCGKRFSNRTDFNKHTRIHTGEKPFGCDVCGKRFSRQSNLKIHTTIHTGDKPFSCDVCNKGFCHKSKLKKHMRIHTGEKPYGCDVCSQKFNRKSTLSKHMRIHTGEKPFSCNVCSQKFNRKSNLSKHMRIHTGEKPYGCDEELWESLKEKQETDITAVTVKREDEEEEAQCSLLHWRQSEENIKGEPATCSSAKLMKVEPNGDISEGPEAANTWTQPDSDGEETDCSDTEDSEDWREPLSQSEAQSEHMDMSCESFQTSDNNTHKPHGCDLCGKQFPHRSNHSGQMKCHAGEKLFDCDVCGKEFRCKSDLIRHIRIHTGEKPYGCDVCSQKFNQKASLFAHMRIHTGEKPFGCDVCGKGFHRKPDLNRHMRIHTRAGVTK